MDAKTLTAAEYTDIIAQAAIATIRQLVTTCTDAEIEVAARAIANNAAMVIVLRQEPDDE